MGRERFSRRLSEALGRPLPEAVSGDALQRLEQLERHLYRFGRSVDLSGFDDPRSLTLRYFAEPLAALPWMPEDGEAWDLGSGGGSPGLPLAIVRNAMRWTLVEPAKKKALFIEEVARELGLSRLRVRRARWQEEPPAGAAVVSTRGLKLAEGEAERIAAGLAPGGRFLWFSGERRLGRAREILASGSGRRLDGPHRLVPGGGFLLVVESRGEPAGPGGP